MATYKGETNFILQSEEPAGEHFGLPTIEQIWKGAAPQFDAFWKAHATGISHADGYIVRRRGVNKGMYPEIALSIALPPDFQAYKIATGRMQQTSAKGRIVENSSILTGYLSVQAERRISFIAPQITYLYFASARPDGPRFTRPIEKESPKMLRSVIYAKGDEIDEDWEQANPGKQKRSDATWYDSAPAPLVAALDMPAVGLITGHSAIEIPGTPWFECQDIISYVYRGDDS
jgi:hypothetical protein